MSWENDVREDESPEPQRAGNGRNTDYGKSALGGSMISTGSALDDRSRDPSRAGRQLPPPPPKRSQQSSNQQSTGPTQKNSKNTTTVGGNRGLVAIFCLVILIGTIVAPAILMLRITFSPKIVPNTTDPCSKDRGLIAKEDELGCDCLPDRINLLPELESQEFCPPKSCDLNFKKSENDEALGAIVQDIIKSLPTTGGYLNLARVMFFATMTAEARILVDKCSDFACKADLVADLVRTVAVVCPHLTDSRAYRTISQRWRTIFNPFYRYENIWRSTFVVYKACVAGLLDSDVGLNATDVVAVYNESSTFTPENGHVEFLKKLAHISVIAMLRETKNGGELRSIWATITGATEREESDYLFNEGNWTIFVNKCYRPLLDLFSHPSYKMITEKDPLIDHWLAFWAQTNKFFESCKKFVEKAPPLMQPAGNRTFTPLLTFWMLNPPCLRKPNSEDCSAIMKSAGSFREKMTGHWACKKVEKWIPFACESVMADKFCERRCRIKTYWQGRSWIRGNEAGGIVLWSESEPRFHPNCLKSFALP